MSPLPCASPDAPRMPVETNCLVSALRESHEAYQRLFETIPLPAWVREDGTLRILEVNRAARAAYGYTRDEFLRLSAMELRPPEERERFQAFVAARGPSPADDAYTGRWTHVRRDGTRFVAETWSLALVFQSRPARLVIARDVSALLAAEQESRFHAQRFQNIADATSDAIWDWDYAKDTLWWSDSFFSLFGYQRSEFAETLSAWADAVHPQDRARVVASLHKARDQGRERWREEYRFRRHDGTYAHVVDRGRAVRDESGAPRRMVGGMTDITEQARLQRQHLRAQRLESIGTLAGGIAHDLNNMLTPVLLAVEMLKLQPRDAETSRLLSTIETGALRGADLVRQVLTFARGVEGQRKPMQAGLLLREAAHFASETFAPSISVRMELAPDLWPILADATQLNQVLLNLAINARDAMSAGGRLVFSASNVHVSPELAAAHPAARSGPHVLISVRDTGHGIAPEHIDHIFEPFFTTKEVGKGTGLGLSTTHAIVREHEGFITVQSALGEGTVFQLHLPAVSTTGFASDVTPAAETPGRPMSGNGRTILVVDDEPELRTLIRHSLETHGYSVITASDGAEAVAVFAQNQAGIALALTDLVMPILDGAATISALHRINPTLPVVVMSGHDRDGRFAQRMQGREVPFLSKPFKPDQLLAIVAAQFATPPPNAPRGSA